MSLRWGLEFRDAWLLQGAATVGGYFQGDWLLAVHGVADRQIELALHLQEHTTSDERNLKRGLQHLLQASADSEVDFQGAGRNL